MLIPRSVQMHTVNEMRRGQLPKGATLEELDRLVIYFDDPWREYLDQLLDIMMVEELSARERTRQLDLITARIPREDMTALIELEPLEFPSLAEIAAQLPPVTWLWEGWIPRGMLSLLGAVPGTGKSYQALDFGRMVIEGSKFPDGGDVLGGAGNVIYVDAESIPQLVNKRAEAWGMDREQLFLMLPRDYSIIDFGDFEYQNQLIEMAWKLRPALIIVDSLSSVTTRGENNVEDVRAILAFLSRVAGDFDCGMLLIHHLRKRGQSLPLMDALTADDFRGSGHIVAMARSVLAMSVIQVGPEPDRNGPRQLEVVKTNLARYPTPVGVMFVPLETDGVQLVYGEAPRRYKETQGPTRVEECADWMVELLQGVGEPVSPRVVIEMGQEEGYSRSLIYRARGELRARIVDTEETGHHPDNCWELVALG